MHVCVCVCVCLRVRVHTYVRTYAYINVCMYAYMHACMYTSMFVHYIRKNSTIHTQKHTHTCRPSHTNVRIKHVTDLSKQLMHKDPQYRPPLSTVETSLLSIIQEENESEANPSSSDWSNKQLNGQDHVHAVTSARTHSDSGSAMSGGQHSAPKCQDVDYCFHVKVSSV
jgi:hypothetical protein